MHDVGTFLGGLGRVSVQAGLLVVIILVIQRLFRRQLSPRWRCALWLLVAVRLLLPVSIESPTSVFNALPPSNGFVGFSQSELFFGMQTPQEESEAVAKPRNLNGVDSVGIAEGTTALPSPSVTRVPEQRVWTKRDQPFPLKHVLFVVWITGAFLLGLRLLWAAVRANCLLRQASPVNDPTIVAQLEECAREMRVRTPPVLVESTKLSTPALCGMWRPRLILPQGLRQQLSSSALRFVFLHELAHLKRLDIAQSWVFSLLQMIHWFNPLVWVAGWRLRVDRELACDALALETAGESARVDYGETILRLLEQVGLTEVSPGVVGILESRHRLKQRLVMIAGFRIRPKWSLLAIVVVACLAMIGLTDARELSSSGSAKKDSRSTEKEQDSAPIPGQIVDPHNNPIQGAKIQYVYPPTEHFDRPTDTWVTDERGKFTAELPISGPSELKISIEGFRTKALSVAPLSRELRVRLYPILDIQGRVIDASTGMPAECYQIVLGEENLEEPWSGEGDLPKIVWRASGAACTSSGFTITLDQDMRESLRGDKSPVVYVGVQALGYAPVASGAISLTNRNVELNFQTKPTKNLSGRILDAEGKPCPLAAVIVPTWGYVGHLRAGKLIEATPASVADSNGRYEIPGLLTDPADVYVVDDRGYAHVTTQVLFSHPDIVLKKWGRIEGSLQPGIHPWRPEKLALFVDGPFLPGGPHLDYTTDTDEAGNFTFDRVPPEEIQIHRMEQTSAKGYSYQRIARVQVLPGEVTKVKPPKGRPAIFRLEIPAELQGKLAFQFLHSRLERDLPYPRPTVKLSTTREVGRWYAYRSPADLASSANLQPPCLVDPRPDGTLAIASIPEGRHRLYVSIRGLETDGPRRRGGGYVLETLDIPPIPSGQETAVIDLGTLLVHPFTESNVGDLAPEFTLLSSKGKPVRLKDYRGRYLVLDFYLDVYAPGPEGQKDYSILTNEMRRNKKLSCLTFYSKLYPEDADTCAKEVGITWSLVDLGQSRYIHKTRFDYLNFKGSVFLIGPDGRIVAIAQTIEELKPALAKVTGGDGKG